MPYDLVGPHTNDCWLSKHKVQDLIDSGTIVFASLEAKSISQNLRPPTIQLGHPHNRHVINLSFVNTSIFVVSIKPYFFVKSVFSSLFFY